MARRCCAGGADTSAPHPDPAAGWVGVGAGGFFFSSLPPLIQDVAAGSGWDYRLVQVKVIA